MVEGDGVLCADVVNTVRQTVTPSGCPISEHILTSSIYRSGVLLLGRSLKS